MTRFLRIFSGVILLALLSTVGVVCAAEANISVSKVVNSTGPYKPGDNVEWVVTIRNNGPDDATNITMKENISQLLGHQAITVKVGDGEYNSTTNDWKIPKLENATSTSLTLITNFSTAGEKTNKVNITVLDQMDPYPKDNHAEKSVFINHTVPVKKNNPLSVKLSIKPTTLNLKSKGVFTVFVTLDGIYPEGSADNETKPLIDFDNSTLTCGEAELIRASVSNKDGGTLIAKFYRQDLMNVTNGSGVRINCSGTISVNGKNYDVEGSDTIRVIGEKKGLDKFLSDLKKYLGIEKDDIEINETEDGNTTLTITLNTDSFKNKGQVKKMSENQGDESETNTDDSQSDKTRGPREKEVKNTGNNKNFQKNNADDTGKGNNNPKGRDDESPGNSNGKKNK
jgi:uncharacterized repeat protein (TIGR01451 family)